MQATLKKVLLVNDIATVGKVASTISLPIFSIAQIEVNLLPTVLLSSHTAFQSFYKNILTIDLKNILQELKKLPITFDCVVTGYFGSTEQLDLFLNHVPNSNLLIVDPIMADNGKLYAGFTPGYIQKIKQLCQKANTILPNLTEACLLLNKEVKPHYTTIEIEEMLDELLALGCQTAIITGIEFDNTTLSVAFKSKAQSMHIISAPKIPIHFSGTGDLFTTIVTSGLIKNIPLYDTVKFAMFFIIDCLNDTLQLKNDKRFGIVFEKQLHKLHQFIEQRS